MLNPERPRCVFCDAPFNNQNDLIVHEKECDMNGQLYTVKPGDCLWSIARRFYQDGTKYRAILAANQRLIANEDLIYPNQVLFVPNLPGAAPCASSFSC